MGTNYFAVENRGDCHDGGTRRHVGKSYRTVRVYLDDTEPIRCWRDWLVWFAENDPVIVDEYGAEVPLDEFVASWQPRPDAVERVEANNALWREWFSTGLGDYVDGDGFYCCSREFT